jgi:hypothetical protein
LRSVFAILPDNQGHKVQAHVADRTGDLPATLGRECDGGSEELVVSDITHVSWSQGVRGSIESSALYDQSALDVPHHGNFVDIAPVDSICPGPSGLITILPSGHKLVHR